MSTKEGKKSARKKNKGSKEKNKDKLSQVDKTFYELTIADLNKKLARLRSHMVGLEDSNNNLLEKIRSLNEDRIDVAAHLERTLIERNQLITELEDRLIEITHLRNKEKEQSSEHIKDLENKYKAMRDQLSSEVKLLSGKLNSLDEFRIQRENLLCKVDDLEALIKEKERAQQEILYKMEQKAVVEKDALKKEVEAKLLQVSEDFTRSSEIRNAGYTRRLIRENIALQKEIDVLVLSQMKMQADLKEQVEQHKIMVEQYNALDELKNQLIYSSKNKITIIDKLTANYERLKMKYTEVTKYKNLYENIMKRDVCERFTFKDISKKLRTLGRRLEQVKLERNRLCTMYKHRESEIHRLTTGMQQIKASVVSAIHQKADDGKLDSDQANVLSDLKRQDLLHELMDIINQNELRADVATSVVTVSRSHSSIYRPGRMGFVPRENSSLMEIFKRHSTAASYKETMSGEFQLREKTSKIIPEERRSRLGSLFDVEMGSTLYVSSSHENVDIDVEVEENADVDVEEEQSSSDLVNSDSKSVEKFPTKPVEESDPITAPKSPAIENEETNQIPAESPTTKDPSPSLPTAENDEFDINLLY